jgi:hypothetical protein
MAEQDSEEVKHSHWPMNEMYTIQMTAMMVCANMYNSSPGRNAETTAQHAVHGATALWDALEVLRKKRWK